MLREARESANVTQSELADALGIAPPTLSRIENGHTGLAAHHIPTVVEVLGLTEDDAEVLRAAAAAPGVRLADIAAQLDRIEGKLDRLSDD